MSRKIYLIWVTIIILLAGFAVTTEGVTDTTLCNSSIPITLEVVEETKANVLVIGNKEMDIIFVLAFDWNKDGIYESLLFDINGNGEIELQLEGGQATAEQVLMLYCQMHQLEMS